MKNMNPVCTPVNYAYFPTLHQAVIFRNWGSIEAKRLAEVLETSVENIRISAQEMGLDPYETVDVRWNTRGYITIIRNNWHLLCEEQLLHLLGWSKERLEFTLKEDDFLYIKLGSCKPDCRPVYWRPLTDEEREHTELIRRTVCGAPGDKWQPFTFLDELQIPEIPERRNGRAPADNEVSVDESWYLRAEGFDGAIEFAAERFRKRMLASWGVNLKGTTHPIVLRKGNFGEKPLKETHRVIVEANEIIIEGADAFGAMRGLTDLEEMFDRVGAPVVIPGKYDYVPRFELRFLYPYVATFGDAFIDENTDLLPDGLLDRLMTAGVNGIWLHSVLYQMVEFPFDPAISEGREKRIATLNRFIEKAAKYGIGVYLYVNEPRAMPDGFFEKHPHLAGHRWGDGFTSLCTSRPEVQDYLRKGMHQLVSSAPGLAGIFTITMSENQTNCYSREVNPDCPVCSKRTPWEVTAEVNHCIEEGVHSADPEVQVICWNWGWQETRGFPREKIEAYIDLMPENVWVQSTSETLMDYEIAGIRGRVLDYSISLPGPGEVSRRYWRAARQRGLRCSAKIQANNSWECGALPYLPVMDLVREHMDNLAKEQVTGLQISWSLGGYPSENLRRLSRYFWQKDSIGEKKSSVDIAQGIFSEAFRNFPFSVDTLYFAPQHMGPANPLLAEKTKWKSSMVGLPYDDLATWCNIYPAEVFENQFRKLYTRWQDGIAYLAENAPEEQELLNISRAACNHFESVYQQVRFVRMRDAGYVLQEMRDIVRRELEIIHSHLKCIAKDSRIGFEASNHYFYTRISLLEAAVACEYLLEKCGD